ncbi:MAG: class I SAM-dependent methyltransferase [Isosphaeraceae bacterium]|nr:class I SAM-dependent methyltransferase [Isosphaeraceae bacterium]
MLLLEALAARPTDVALEIGTGSGSSLFRLAGSVATLHGVDIAARPVERLRGALAKSRGPARGVQLFTLDFCSPDAAARLPTRYDLIFSCDTVEHVPDPVAFFANVYAALGPGGRAFITFPNESPDRAHGITFFERREDLEGVLQAAGFPREQVAIHTLRMNRVAEWIMGAGWLLPRALAKRAAGLLAGRSRRNGAPQTFDETDFFATADRLEPVAPLINAYCWGVLRLMSLARPVYEAAPAPEVLWDTRILIRVQRTGEPAHAVEARAAVGLG